MDTLLLGTLPTDLQQLLRGGAALNQVAGQAARFLEKLPNAEEQAALGKAILRALIDRADAAQRTMVERALEVMDKFPHFPRPRAAVVRQALKSLAQN
ncbi:MAG: hypothetical protein AB1758_09610 [Candidatus Eremiobacterota bacterium]